MMDTSANHQKVVQEFGLSEFHFQYPQESRPTTQMGSSPAVPLVGRQPTKIPKVSWGDGSCVVWNMAPSLKKQTAQALKLKGHP